MKSGSCLTRDRHIDKALAAIGGLSHRLASHVIPLLRTFEADSAQRSRKSERGANSPLIVREYGLGAVRIHNATMHIAILTFQGFNELDSFIALGILNRVQARDWRVSICCPDPEVVSMNGVKVRAQSLLEDARDADAVIVGSGVRTREIVADSTLLRRIELDAGRQLIGAQCSGTLILARLGLLGAVPACTDLVTKPWVQEAGVEVLNQPFFARGNIATAGGCLASHYLAAWIIARTEGVEAAEAALHYVAPVGEKDAYVTRALNNISPYLPRGAATAEAA
jgi:putative intracellular protease/amidase